MGHLLNGRTDRPIANIHSAQIVGAGDHQPRGLSTYRDMPAFGLLQHAAEQIPNRTAIIYGDSKWDYAQVNPTRYAQLRCCNVLAFSLATVSASCCRTFPNTSLPPTRFGGRAESRSRSAR